MSEESIKESARPILVLTCLFLNSKSKRLKNRLKYDFFYILDQLSINIINVVFSKQKQKTDIHIYNMKKN